MCAVLLNLKSPFILAHVQLSFCTDPGKRPMPKTTKISFQLQMQKTKVLLKVIVAVLAGRSMLPPSEIKELVLGTKIFDLFMRKLSFEDMDAVAY